MASFCGLPSHMPASTMMRHRQGAVPSLLRRNANSSPEACAANPRAAANEEACDLASSPDPVVPSPPATNAQPMVAERMLPRPPDLRGKAPRSSWNATALAFMGDAVWEVYARRKYFYPPTRMAAYYQSVVRSVRAESQAELYTSLVQGRFLTEEERDVLRWGRNATGSTSPKRFGQGDMSREVYRAATAVECLVGFLYLTDPLRLDLLMGELGMNQEDCQ